MKILKKSSLVVFASAVFAVFCAFVVARKVAFNKLLKDELPTFLIMKNIKDMIQTIIEMVLHKLLTLPKSLV